MARRYLTKPQGAILDFLVRNGGRAVIYTGGRRTVFVGSTAYIFGQSLHSLLQNRWITSAGANMRCSFALTAAGVTVQRDRWYVPQHFTAYWLDSEPAAAGASA